ncbi:MAG: CoA-binding protein [Dehalococcoidales bacterium]|nr:CoA-binding protein [Dehalococcoidales bacterium]
MPSLDEIFSPRGIAVVGVSPSGSNPFATIVVKGLLAGKYPAIYPVNPKYTEVDGLKCYPSLEAIPGVVDHVIVAISAQAALTLLDECAAKGVRSVHFFTAGFRESGIAERAALEKAMLAKAKAGGFRIVGPNCVGLYVPKSRVIIDAIMPTEPGPIGFLSQSGGHAQDLVYLGAPRGLRFSKVISYGNALDIDECELLGYFANDPETGIIAAYLEGVKNGRRFLAALRRAASRKPVVIYKGGMTGAGSRTTQGHTASLATGAATFRAVCRQCGALLVEDLDELNDVLVAWCFATPHPRGKGIAVAGGGGGPSVSASDEFEKAGLSLPRLSVEQQAQLRQVLPNAGAIFTNPIDANNLAAPEAIDVTMRILGSFPQIDMLLYHLGFHPIGRWGEGRFSAPEFLQPVIESLRKVRQSSGKPVLVALRPAPDAEGFQEFLAAQQTFAAAGFPVFHSMRQAARAMSYLIDMREKQF